MKVVTTKIHRSGIILAVLVLTLCTGLLHATNEFTLTPSTTLSLTCSTVSGPGPATQVTVKGAASITYPVTISLPNPNVSGITATLSSGSFTLTSSTSTAVLNVTALPGCQYLTGVSPVTATMTLFHGATADVPVIASVAVTATTSALTVSPITVSCTSPSTVPNVVVPVTSGATGGTPFSVVSSLPTWLTEVGSGSGLNANPSASLTFHGVAASCPTTVGSSLTGTITLSNAPAPNKLVSVTLLSVAAATLTATPVQTSESYTKGSGFAYYPSWTVNLNAPVSPVYFTVNPTTLGSWLTANTTSGTSGLTSSIIFQATSAIDLLAPGTYSQIVHLSVSDYADTTVTLKLVVQSPPATLSFSGGNVQNLTWIQGKPIPTATITAVSSGSPIQYAITTSGTIAPVIASTELQGFAYSFGTQVPVTFPYAAFAGAQPGSVLQGVATFTYGSLTNSVTFNITVQATTSTANLTSVSPTNLPTATAGQQFTVTLYGSGFVPGSDPTQRTNVGIISGGAITADTLGNFSSTVVNSSTISVTLTVPTGVDALLPWTSASTITIGVCNPSGGVCTSPTGTQPLIIGAGPLVSSIVSASTFAAPLGVAPYDVLTIWGSNFCSSNGSGCNATTVLYGSLNPSTLTYATALSPDNGQRNVTVTFKQTGGVGSPVPAPLLFVTNNQMNVLVPAAGFPTTGTVDIIVNFGTLSSTVTTLAVANTDPGLFTIDAYGQGAILNSATGTVVNGANPAVMLSASTASVVEIYGTGLGTPTSLTGSTAVTYNSINCMTPAAYETAAGITALDGVVLQSLLLNGDYAPCFGDGAPTGMIGGQTAVLGYSGWVADAVAGLYQVNATLGNIAPSSGNYTDAAGVALAKILAPVQLPVVITANSVASQAAVTMWVMPALTISGGPGATTSHATGSNTLATYTASGSGAGSPTYTWTYSPQPSGLLPASGAVGATFAFTHTPTAQGVYLLNITATDNNGVAATKTLQYTVTGASNVTVTSTPVLASTFGTANAAVTTVTGGGETGAFTYTISPVALGITTATGIVSTSASTPAGTYHTTVTATNTNTSDANIIEFDVPVAMTMASSNGLTLTGVAGLASTQALTTVSATGGTSPTFALATVEPDSSQCAFTVNSSSGVVTAPSSCVAGTYSLTVVATDTSSDTGTFTHAVSTLNLSIHLN